MTLPSGLADQCWHGLMTEPRKKMFNADLAETLRRNYEASKTEAILKEWVTLRDCLSNNLLTHSKSVKQHFNVLVRYKENAERIADECKKVGLRTVTVNSTSVEGASTVQIFW